MKVVILAGGRGTRLAEETGTRPKPMVEIGDRPILWHIMAYYASFGHRDFVICGGYKSQMIKEYFANYLLYNSDVTFDLDKQSIHVIQKHTEDWKVTVVDTGQDTMTGGRLLRIRPFVQDGTFMFTYGDGLANVDLDLLLRLHQSTSYVVTLTAVRPSGRFGALELNGQSRVKAFVEKPAGDGGWINGGFFAAEPSLLDFIADDSTVLEQEPLSTLARLGKLGAHLHSGFWLPMDTVRDRDLLRELWASGDPPWHRQTVGTSGGQLK